MKQVLCELVGGSNAVEDSTWGVAVTGAAIAIVATVTSSTLLYQVRAEIDAARVQIESTRRTVERLWSNHREADQRATSAGLFVAQALEPSAGREFLLDQAAYHMRGAVLSMLAASGEPVPDVPPEAVVAAESGLRAGDAKAYALLQSEVDRLRLLSQSHINRLNDVVRGTESRVESLRSRESWIYLAYVFFNLLGLMVAMCKDLPVWRAERAAAGAG